MSDDQDISQASSRAGSPYRVAAFGRLAALGIAIGALSDPGVAI
ncbi:MAG: hypothetical protein NXH85_00930 [Pseudomonadaceae bacterium]|nr:hypothetical protein [Pseudomonadaceae bacterium]